MSTRASNTKEVVMKWVFTACACISILAVALICIFLFANGLPTLFKIGPLKFLLGTTWKPGNDIYGILPMILGSIYVTAGAIVVGVPIGLLTAIYMSRFASKRINKVLLPAVQLLAGIPSVVYGFFGMVVLVPSIQAVLKTDFVRKTLHITNGKGMSLFTASLLLGIMILPTIITVSKTSLDAVPQSYYEGSLALGATHERSVFFTVLPAAKSGVLSAVILGIGRAIGETMAVVMVAGNQTWMPQGLFQGLRTMTSNIVIEMGYAADLHREALIATGVVLFVFILLINVSFSLVKEREKNA
ncbi:phosphate ABC transporter permease subunit PstC [uncultured Gemmiger sp.]|uniref:phosphate ABC transporter permease subunit PstC n=1 Tax=uncultured Gemmiger sp. TaxID=1623490 RepID=UPI0025F438EE|nr:phosphate ABC transporter permease subunit PstC [uncultured Gemmiger sp.]